MMSVKMHGEKLHKDKPPNASVFDMRRAIRQSYFKVLPFIRNEHAVMGKCIHIHGSCIELDINAA